MIVLPDGAEFNVRAYLDSQQRATASLAASMPDMHALITRFNGVSAPHKAYPERTLMSYVLQEAEAVSRTAKLHVLVHLQCPPLNLQHDGVVAAVSALQRQEAVLAALGAASGAALRYGQRVEAKPMEAADGVHVPPMAAERVVALVTGLAGAARGPRRRTVATPNAGTLHELCMAPLHYNPHFAGPWGAKVLEPRASAVRDRSKWGRARLQRVSQQRRAAAEIVYAQTQLLARYGFTHGRDLLRGWVPGARLRFIKLAEFQRPWCVQQPDNVKNVLRPRARRRRRPPVTGSMLIFGLVRDRYITCAFC